jgi:zinc transport system ATP-binding protein
MNNPIISVKNVSKTIDSRQLLIDVSFDVANQSLVSLIGPNGAGKSTLIKIILGLDKHYTGTVTVRSGERVQYIPQLSIIDQYQLPMSVYEYFSIATNHLYSHNRKDIDFEEALTHVGVSFEKLHQSYASLSGGERQRVAIARALMGDPTVLVLDEPLAAVDYTSRPGLYELIRHLQQVHKITVLLVSHDIDSILPLSDKVLCLNKFLNTDCHPSLFQNDGHQNKKTFNHNC